MKNNTQTLICFSLFAVAFALVEAAVVIYLRELYFPGGFLIKTASDLKVMSAQLLNVEVAREVATIIMLAAVSCLSYSGIKRKIAAFVFAFSLWDLFYYLFFYILIKWPPSFQTVDVYFLIPQPLVGPVWVPILIFFILGAQSLNYLLRNQK
jgi:hypothetical protein